ncbi:MAG: peptidylprolyl isomerase [Candidatus Melainabacteria bacterium RIFOXYA12_FULL_32_12]|nr:MAG: peptidylprolyl isomerase [Candidatus Melainabacteria bacterium RIFOXYA2_FULL_32_9]OGI25910.1 MAG: peptidylprolyl isomerase [Candidatus Melainabacteria bacterium RIFOXYA12_FULL_32_12]
MEKLTEVRASHILVATKEEADKIREEILNGKDFGHAARKNSKCPSGYQGGDLGFFKRGNMVAEFENAAYTLPINEISEPVKTQFGWHLIMVTDQR